MIGHCYWFLFFDMFVFPLWGSTTYQLVHLPVQTSWTHRPRRHRPSNQGMDASHGVPQNGEKLRVFPRQNGDLYGIYMVIWWGLNVKWLNLMDSNIVLLGKIEGMVWYTIYCHLPPSIKQPVPLKDIHDHPCTASSQTWSIFLPLRDHIDCIPGIPKVDREQPSISVLLRQIILGKL